MSLLFDEFYTVDDRDLFDEDDDLDFIDFGNVCHIEVEEPEEDLEEDLLKD